MHTLALNSLNSVLIFLLDMDITPNMHHQSKVVLQSRHLSTGVKSYSMIPETNNI